MGRPLRIGIARLNRAIADYSLSRLEFTLLHPDGGEPPILDRIGGRPDQSGVHSWADMMKRVAMVQSYVDAAKDTDIALQRDPSFERLSKAVDHVAVLAWSMESMHRRYGDTIS